MNWRAEVIKYSEQPQVSRLMDHVSHLKKKQIAGV
jgi:hypothetical protein